MTNFTYDSSRPRRTFILKRPGGFILEYRLLRVLVLKDFATRYQRSIVGIWWALINPTLSAVVLFFVFHSTYSGKFSSGISFGPYILSGTLVLSFLATGIVTTTQNLVSSATIFTRLPARPEIFALSSAIVLTLNIFMGIIPLAVWNFIQGGTLSPFIFFVPVEALLGCIFITGLALICFVAVVRIGDVINVINIAATLATYLTPVFYPMNAISARAQLFLNLNPLTHFVNIFRKLTLNYGEARWYDWLYCSGSSVLVFIIGLYILNRTWKQTVTLL